MIDRLLLLVPDGAAGALPAATTPAWDALPHAASVTTVPDGLPVVSEVALPSLLGVPVVVAPARGPVEAAGLAVPVGPGDSAWRLDVDQLPGSSTAAAEQLAAALDAPVRHLRRGRFLAVGPHAWLTDEQHGARLRTASAAVGRPVRLWGGGTSTTLPPVPRSTAVISAPTGAAAGTAGLVGADLVVPAGATGFPGTDLLAKATTAIGLLAAGDHAVVVVHVGAPDEAGHAGDAGLQRHCVEAFDREVVAPLATAARRHDLAVIVAPDHVTDPATRQHVGGAVPVRSSVPLPAHLPAHELADHAVGREVAA